jgi:alkylhydroperoxidase family enzyme
VRAGLNEATIAMIADGYETTLAPDAVAALLLTDAIIGVPRPLSDTTRHQLAQHFTASEIAELAFGVALFLGMSKVLINLGLEPMSMPVTRVPTPGER